MAKLRDSLNLEYMGKRRVKNDSELSDWVIIAMTVSKNEERESGLERTWVFGYTEVKSRSYWYECTKGRQLYYA